MDIVQIEQQKRALRRAIRAETAALAFALHAAGTALCRRALELEEYKTAETVLAFVSTAAEPDTSLFLRETLGSGRRLALPLIVGPGLMQARQIDDLHQLEPGPFGILQPPSGAPAVPGSAIGFALVPCMAASLRGERLGHGGGYYDRFLPALQNRWAAACPEALLLPSLPCLAHDLPVPLVVTENRVLRF